MVMAVIMAGGEGTRLRPLTVTRPKPMVPLVNKPMMEHVVDLLRGHGIRRIGVTLHYLPETIMSYFGSGEKWGVEITYSIEKKPLGTAGGVRKLWEELGEPDETMIIISGDVFTDIDLGEMLRYHRGKGSVFTMAVRKVPDPTQYGIALLDEEGRVRRFLEKPGWSEVFSDIINMGIYIVEPDVLSRIPRGREYDFAKHLIPQLLEQGEGVYGWRADRFYWSDIGNHDQYKETHRDILAGKVRVPGGLGREVADKVYVMGEADIESLDNIIPPVVIGGETRIKATATIGPYTVIGWNSIVEDGARIDKSILWSHVYVASSANIVDAIIADKVEIGHHVTVMEGAVIGDETRIGEGSVVKPFIKIWPSKQIDPYTVVSSNIKWGIRWYKTLIEPWGITGLMNIEITPELAARIGLAIGTWLGRNAEAAIARDTYSTSRTLKHALMAGLLSAGVTVHDMGVAPLPVLTHYIASKKLSGGVLVAGLAYDPSRIRIKIFGRRGLFISSGDAKDIESIFFKEAYRRVLADEVGFIKFPGSHIEDYLDTVTRHIDSGAVARAGPPLMDCCFGSSGMVVTHIMNMLGNTALLLNCRERIPFKPRGASVIQQSIDRVSRMVVSLGLPAGFIFDSDGDKVIVIDDRGRAVSGDRLVALVSRILLEKRGGGTVVVPVASSRIIEEVVSRSGGRVVRAGVGLRSIVEAMLRENAVLAADERGAVVYPHIHYGPDAIYTALLVLEYLGETGRRLSELVDEIPEPAMTRRTIVVPYTSRGIYMRLLYEELKEMEIDTLEGIRVFEEELGWAYIRPLPNQPVIEIIAEGENMDKAEKMAALIMEIANNIKKKLGI